MASRAAKKLLGKTAIVTGGSRGIGRAIAAAYVSAGARVFICSRRAADVERTLGEIRAGGGTIDGAAGDVSSAQDVSRIVGAALQSLGAIDVLVNSAGILGPRTAIVDYPIDGWREVVEINLTGIFLMTRAVLPGMLGRRTGSIINLTSGVGRVGKAKWGAYAVSKAGVECFTQVLADEVKSEGIRVNSVNPAATRTPMRAQAYPSEDPTTLPSPESITPIFLFLAADESGNITGQALNARDWIGRGV
jgi:NAD(P)-dependent dehydrogenase (short-subunit alcohol dehydrogenase family)